MGTAISFQSLILSGVAAFASGALLAVVLGSYFHRDARLKSSQSSAAAHAATLDLLPDAVLQFDATLDCTYASVAATRIFGQPLADLVGRNMLALTTEDDAPLQAAVSRARNGHVGAEAVFRVARPTGEQLWVEARLSGGNAEGHIAAVLRDVSTRKTAELALRVANLELNKLAGSDALTDLANRRRFDQTLETECRRASRNTKPVSLLLLDVDRFKIYNERYGHPAGDACLKKIGAAVRGTATRTSDMAARFGGEEFALILPSTDESSAAEMAERVREAVAELALPHEGNAEAGGIVTVSVGCATVRPTPDTLRGDSGTLIGTADRALYDAKRLGRNRVVAPALILDKGAIAEPLVSDSMRLARLDALRAAGSFQPSPNLHRIARMAAVLLGMPMAFVALLDREDAVIIGHYGTGDAPLQVPHAVCAHLLGARGPLVVSGLAADPRFQDFGAEHGLAFLAAAPLLSGDDLQHVGALWVVDRQARGQLDEPKRMLLSRLAALVMEDLEARGPQSPLQQDVA